MQAGGHEAVRLWTLLGQLLDAVPSRFDPKCAGCGVSHFENRPDISMCGGVCVLKRRLQAVAAEYDAFLRRVMTRKSTTVDACDLFRSSDRFLVMTELEVSDSSSDDNGDGLDSDGPGAEASPQPDPVLEQPGKSTSNRRL